VADIRITEWLSKIAGIRSDELMNEISRIDSPLTSKSPEEVINSDRKTYTNGSFKFALSQVEETNLELLHNRQNELVAAMQGVLNSELLAFIGIMVTDAVRGNSELLIIGNSDVLRMLPYQKISDRLYALPGVLSRKKQLLPNILSITTEIDRR